MTSKWSGKINDSERFDRLEKLLGQEAIDKLNRSRVLLVGLGGVGGTCAEALLRSGIRRLTLVDGDRVGITDLNRQVIATEASIGQYKTEAMAKRLLEIDSQAEIRKINRFLLANEEWELDFQNYDFIVDAIDTVASKIELARRSQIAGRPLIAAMGFGNKLDPSKIRIGMASQTRICPLARVYRQRLKKEQLGDVTVVFSEEEPVLKTRLPASNSFVPTAAGICMASHVVRTLAGV